MKKKVNLSLDEEIAVRLKQLAEEDHKTVSQWVTDAVVYQVRAKNDKCSKMLTIEGYE